MVSFWNDCPLVHSDPEIVHGTPVLKGTRLPADALVENVESFMEMDSLTVDEAIAETLDCFPGTPGGAATIRALLAFQESQRRSKYAERAKLVEPSVRHAAAFNE